VQPHSGCISKLSWSRQRLTCEDSTITTDPCSVPLIPALCYVQGSSDSEGDITETSTYGAEHREEGAPSIHVLFDGVGHYDLLLPSADAAGTEPVVSQWTKSKL